MSESISLWRAEHRHFARLLDLLEQQVVAFHADDGPNYELMLDVISYLQDYADQYHHPREDEAFALKNAVAAALSGSAWTRRSVELLRAVSLWAKGHYFLRGGLAAIPAPLSLVADDDLLPRHWGTLNRRLYRRADAKRDYWGSLDCGTNS